MATDKTMPPGDPTSMPSMPPSAGGMPAGGPPQGGAGKDVMITMPRAIFDELHSIVMQLAAGVDELAKRAGAGGGGIPQEPVDEAAGEDMSAEGGSSDEDFLKEMASQANK
jgi:hypothetical protein